MADWYCSSVGWTAVSSWAATHAYSVGNLVRQLATPTVGNERVWRCTTAGTSLGSEPAWTLTKGSTTTESGGPVWTEVTGNSSWQQVGSTSTWTAPHARVENMLAWMASGDRGFVSSDHTQTVAASLTLTSPGNTCQFFSVNRTTGSIPPAAADITNGAAVTCTSATRILAIIGGGFWQGFTFTCGTGTDSSTNLDVNNSGSSAYYFLNCTFAVSGSGGASTIILGSGTSSRMTLDHPTFSFGLAASSLEINSKVEIIGGSLAGTMPTTLFKSVSSGILLMRGFDASALTSSTSIFNGGPGNGQLFSALLADCKLSSTATVIDSSARFSPDGLWVDLQNCDSGGTNYRNERHRYQGDMTTETTITRTGGATNGTQAVSHKVITTANSSIYNPFDLPPIAKWCSFTSGSHTATIEIISSGTLNNNDIWVELEYLGSSGSPIGSVVNDTIATQLTSSAAQTSSTAGWNSSPSTPQKQKLTVTFSPAMAGLVIARVKVAKASTTVYVDPLITLT